jgi:hypothetical protein
VATEAISTVVAAAAVRLAVSSSASVGMENPEVASLVGVAAS